MDSKNVMNNIEILVEYNNSYLLYDKYSLKVNFNGELKNIALGIYKRYGEELIKSKLTSIIWFGSSTLALRKISSKNYDCYHELFYDTTYSILGEPRRPPEFLHVLKGEYKEVFNRIYKMKAFW